MTTNPTPGGFVGDPAEAFTPPAASGCCGSAEATAAGQCCTPPARQEAVDAGTECCG